MKTIATEALESLNGQNPLICGAAYFAIGPGYRYWSGFGQLDIPEDTGGPYIGTGARALITPTSSRMGGAADGLTIVLSKLDPAIAALIEDEDYHQKPVVIRRLFFAPDKRTLLASPVYLRGRLDTVIHRESVGGKSSLEFEIEGPRRDMSRAGARIRSDADQRALGGAAARAFKYVTIAGRIVLNWGGNAGQTPGGVGYGLGNPKNVAGWVRGGK